MPIRKINLIEGHFYRIYNRSVADNLLFIEEKNYHFFLSKIKKYLLVTAEVLAYCLMPNHYHLIIQLKNTELSRSMQLLAMSYATAVNKMYQRSGHVFHGRYQIKHITDQIYLDHLSKYIHLNPSSAGLVVKPEDWEFSSYREYIRLRKLDFTNPMIILDQFRTEDEKGLEKARLNYQRFVEDYE